LCCGAGTLLLELWLQHFFVLVILEMGVLHFPRGPRSWSPCLAICHHRDGRSAPQLCQAIDWDGVLRTVCPGWPWTLILPISASQAARITGMSHQCLADFFYFCKCADVVNIRKHEQRLWPSSIHPTSKHLTFMGPLGCATMALRDSHTHAAKAFMKL
jgi:hypothetical protein